jgi:hypothetical protein
VQGLRPNAGQAQRRGQGHRRASQDRVTRLAHIGDVCWWRC